MSDQDGRGELMARLVEAQIVQRVWEDMRGDPEAMRAIREAVSRAAVDKLVVALLDDYVFKQMMAKEITALVMPIARDVAQNAVELRKAEIADRCAKAVSQAIGRIL